MASCEAKGSVTYKHRVLRSVRSAARLEDVGSQAIGFETSARPSRHAESSHLKSQHKSNSLVRPSSLPLLPRFGPNSSLTERVAHSNSAMKSPIVQKVLEKHRSTHQLLRYTRLRNEVKQAKLEMGGRAESLKPQLSLRTPSTKVTPFQEAQSERPSMIGANTSEPKGRAVYHQLIKARLAEKTHSKPDSEAKTKVLIAGRQLKSKQSGHSEEREAAELKKATELKRVSQQASRTLHSRNPSAKSAMLRQSMTNLSAIGPNSEEGDSLTATIVFDNGSAIFAPFDSEPKFQSKEGLHRHKAINFLGESCLPLAELLIKSDASEVKKEGYEGKGAQQKKERRQQRQFIGELTENKANLANLIARKTNQSHKKTEKASIVKGKSVSVVQPKREFGVAADTVKDREKDKAHTQAATEPSSNRILVSTKRLQRNFPKDFFAA